MKKHLEFLEWFSRFNPTEFNKFVAARRYELMTGQLGVGVDAEKLALLQEAVNAGLLIHKTDVSNGAVNDGDAVDQ